MENVDPTVAELGEVAALREAVKVFRKVETTLVGSELQILKALPHFDD